MTLAFFDSYFGLKFNPKKDDLTDRGILKNLSERAVITKSYNG